MSTTTETPVPSNPAEIAAQINAEAAQTAGESNADPIGYDSVAGYEKFRLSEKYPGRLPKVTPLKARNLRKIDPFGAHSWTAPNGWMLAEFYRYAEREWIVILWPRNEDGTLAGKFMGKGETTRAAYKAAHRDMRLGKYDKAALLREKALAEDIVSMFGKMLVDRSEMVDFLEKRLQQAETHLREVNTDERIQDLRIKLDAALSKIDQLEKPGEGAPGIARPNVDVIITRAEYLKLLEKADQEVATAQKGAEYHRRATRAEALNKQYREQILRSGEKPAEVEPATAEATS